MTPFKRTLMKGGFLMARILKDDSDNRNLMKRGNMWYIKRMVNGRVIFQSTHETNIIEARKVRDSVLNPVNLRDDVERAEAVFARVQTVDQQHAKAVDALPALTVVDTWAAFLKSPERSDASERTIAGYLCQWKRFERWIEKRRDEGPEERRKERELRDVTVQDAFDYAADLVAANRVAADQVKDNKIKPVTPNTFNKHIVLLEMIFRVLTDTARIGLNPWAKIKRKRLCTQGRRVLTVAELQTVLEKATGELKTLLIIGSYSGLRLGDAVTLNWSSVDLDLGIITLRPKKTAKSTGKIVAIPIHPTLKVALEQTPPSKRTGPVLPQLAKMREVNPDGINYRLQKHFTECGIITTVDRDGVGRKVPVAGFHALRHTIVSQLASRGVPLETVRGLVGHGGDNMTRAYVHQNAESARAAVEALPALTSTSAADIAAARLASVKEQAEKLEVPQIEKLLKMLKKFIRSKKTTQQTETAVQTSGQNTKQGGTVAVAKTTANTGAVKQTDGRN